MKKLLSLLVGVQTLMFSAQAGILLYDDFSYPDGNIVTTSAGAWTVHSGTSADSMVSGGKYEINQNRRDDVNRAFTTPNGEQYLFASFILNVTELPTTSGTYFAHFKDDTTSNFLARVSISTGNAVLPGTYRLGIANASSSTTNFFPMDLATNVGYQVVVSYDIVNYISTLQVNPAAAEDPSAVNSSVVSGSAAIAVLSTYAFRQASNEGVMTVDNLLVGNSFADVVTNAAVAPAIAREPVGATVFAGSDYTFSVLASGMGQLTYKWRKDGVELSEGGSYTGTSSNVLAITGVTASEAGIYDVVITGSGGDTTSQTATLIVDVTPVAPQITTQPASVTNSLGSTVTFTATVTGSMPLAYQWTFYGTNMAGATEDSLTLTSVTTANTGPYRLKVSNSVGNAESDIAYLFVPPPVKANIAYLRTLLDPTTFLPTNTTTLFETEGVVTTFTNITTAANAQFYINDGTAGIVVYIGGGAAYRPLAGDRVRVVGPLGHYNSVLECNLSASNPLHTVEILSSGNAMPNAKPFHFSQTNDVAFMEREIEGSLVTVTNVYFQAADGSATFKAGTSYTITNDLGQTFVLRVDGRVTSLVDVTIPLFAYQVTGCMGQFLSATATPRNNGYQLMVTRPEDIVTVLPPAPTIKMARSETGVSLSWPVQPGSTYSVLSSDNLAQGFSIQSFGLNSLASEVSFTDTNTTANAKFYRVTSP